MMEGPPPVTGIASFIGMHTVAQHCPRFLPTPAAFQASVKSRKEQWLRINDKRIA